MAAPQHQPISWRRLGVPAASAQRMASMAWRNGGSGRRWRGHQRKPAEIMASASGRHQYQRRRIVSRRQSRRKYRGGGGGRRRLAAAKAKARRIERRRIGKLASREGPGIEAKAAAMLAACGVAHNNIIGSKCSSKKLLALSAAIGGGSAYHSLGVITRSIASEAVAHSCCPKAYRRSGRAAYSHGPGRGMAAWPGRHQLASAASARRKLAKAHQPRRAWWRSA